jgi:transglutaminase-like putative cysteine protease
MLIRIGYDIHFEVPAPVPIVAMLHVHPTCMRQLQTPDDLHPLPATKVESYLDSFGNRCSRFLADAGTLQLSSESLIYNSGLPDAVEWNAPEKPIHELPPETLRYLLNSRYCEVDRLSNIAVELFGSVAPGWSRAQAICNWVHSKVLFGYQFARPTKTALDVFTERTGVCRDFQHLAVTFCRALNIPARYATGYLPDIGVPLSPAAMDFSAWYEVYLGDRWWTFDARYNTPRIGRVLLATGRDAADVAITTSFGLANLTFFQVTGEEVSDSTTLPSGSGLNAS